MGAKVALFLAYNGYLLAAVYHYYATSEDGEGPDWCDGLGFLVILTVMVYGYVLYSRLLVPAVTYVLVQTKPGRDGVKMVRALGRKVFGWRVSNLQPFAESCHKHDDFFFAI